MATEQTIGQIMHIHALFSVRNITHEYIVH